MRAEVAELLVRQRLERGRVEDLAAGGEGAVRPRIRRRGSCRSRSARRRAPRCRRRARRRRGVGTDRDPRRARPRRPSATRSRLWWCSSWTRAARWSSRRWRRWSTSRSVGCGLGRRGGVDRRLGGPDGLVLEPARRGATVTSEDADAGGDRDPDLLAGTDRRAVRIAALGTSAVAHRRRILPMMMAPRRTGTSAPP